MNKNDIKKELYKNNPVATLAFLRKGTAHYKSNLGESTIAFSVPVADMGDADFFPEMDSKLLIRWISLSE
jgi:hypothetical protein